MKVLTAIIVITGMFFLLPVELIAQQYKIEVQAGGFDRMNSVTSFFFPDAVDAGVYLVQGEYGEEVIVQVDENNRGWLKVSDLPAGESVVFLFDAEETVNRSGVSYRNDDDTALFRTGYGSVLRYIHGSNKAEMPDGLGEQYKRGGYIHPVYSPNGVVLTNHLNIDQHPHHSGIWSAWTRTEFEDRTPDFWNVHANTGRVDVQPETFVAWEGPVFAGFTSKHKFIDLSASGAPEVALNEKWDVRVFNSGNDYHKFDLTVTQTVNTDKPLILPEYRYGGVGFRGHVEWDDPENCTFLTDEGLGRDGHGTRTRWTHIGGTVNGELAGIAIMSHPVNFRHPQTVRIHPTEPFFNYAPQQLGDMSIEPGSPYVVTYRYITYDGEPDSELLDQLWYDFAYPPGVSVTIVN